MKMKTMIRRHVGSLVVAVGMLVAFPLAALSHPLDAALGLADADGDGPTPIFLFQCGTLLMLIGIVLEVVNPIRTKKETAANRTSEGIVANRSEPSR